MPSRLVNIVNLHIHYETILHVFRITAFKPDTKNNANFDAVLR